MPNLGPEHALLASIRESLHDLETLLEETSTHWQYEDPVYRFYHHSFKLFAIQRSTESIVAALQALRPEVPLNEDFMEIVHMGTGKSFSQETNRDWLQSTKPLLEALFHARFFLEMIVKYGRTLQHPPTELPSGWAAVLYLYRLR